MTHATRIIITVTWAWWFKPYLAALEFFCNLMGAKPDPDKLWAVTRRAVRLNGKSWPKSWQ